MNIAPALKAVMVLAPTSTTNGATATGTLDCVGYDWLTLDVFQTTSNTPTNNLSTCKLSEGDDTNTFTDITALVGDGAGGFTIPNADSSNPQLYKFNLDLRGRKRYLKLTLTPLTTQTLMALANLGRGEIAPTTATRAGTALLVEG